jgi:hypothetical protein
MDFLLIAAAVLIAGAGDAAAPIGARIRRPKRRVSEALSVEQLEARKASRAYKRTGFRVEFFGAQDQFIDQDFRQLHRMNRATFERLMQVRRRLRDGIL